MKAYERLAVTSGRSSRLGAGAWALAVVVVAVLALTLHLLHG